MSRTTVTVKSGNRINVKNMGIPGPEGKVGLSWKGDYAPDVQYAQRDAVFYLGSSYIFVNPNPATNIAPGNTQYWNVLAAGAVEGGSFTADKTFVHTQTSASATWSIMHGLSKYPSVTVVDSGGSEVEGDVRYIDLNNVVVTFSAPFGGKAYIN